jgi:hypothetical protein
MESWWLREKRRNDNGKVKENMEDYGNVKEEKESREL